MVIVNQVLVICVGMNSFNMAKELFTQMQPKADDYISRVNNMVSRFEEAGGPTILK